MSTHVALLDWRRTAHPIDTSTYSRNHIVTLNGGQALAVSAPAAFGGDPVCADPEQLLVGAVSSCHMLVFLAVAEQEGFTVEAYEDRAIGHLEKNSAGKLVVSRIELHPAIRFGGDERPSAAAIDRMHAAAHTNCFIGNSVTADVVVRARPGR